MNRCLVGRSDFQEKMSCAVSACNLHKVMQQRSAQALTLIRFGNADVEQMRFVQHQHRYGITDDDIVLFIDPATVTGIERIAEITARPGVSINLRLNRHDSVDIRHLHGSELGLWFKDSTHFWLTRSSRSFILNATLLRM